MTQALLTNPWENKTERKQKNMLNDHFFALCQGQCTHIKSAWPCNVTVVLPCESVLEVLDMYNPHGSSFDWDDVLAYNKTGVTIDYENHVYHDGGGNNNMNDDITFFLGTNA